MAGKDPFAGNAAPQGVWGHPTPGSGGWGAYGQVAPVATPAPQGQPGAQPAPVVIVQPQEQYYPFLPDATAIAGRVDGIARRIPWFVWFGAGMAAMWWLRKRRGGVQVL